MKPLLLDGCCCAGCASMGYHRAGFRVEGCDVEAQPRYPFPFHQADVLEFIKVNWRRYDAYHVSPPCQRFSPMSNCRPGLAGTYPDLIGPLRDLLDEIGKPYVIENVVGAPLRDPVTLCGHMFGLPLYRHRLFEANFPLAQPDHPEHTLPASKAGHWKPGTIISVAGHCSPMKLAREAMGGVDWPNRAELAEAIPPVYAEHVGAQLMAAVRGSEVAA